MKHDTDPTPCEIRRATLDDLDAIVTIESLSFSSPWPRSAFVGEIKARSWSNVFVAESDGRIVGFMVYWSVVGELHLLNLAIHPSWRRRGIGARMVASLVESAQNDAQREILLEARVSNHGARRLYESFGFKELTTRKGYYADNGEDAIVMGLTIETDPEDSSA